MTGESNEPMDVDGADKEGQILVDLIMDLQHALRNEVKERETLSKLVMNLSSQVEELRGQLFKHQLKKSYPDGEEGDSQNTNENDNYDLSGSIIESPKPYFGTKSILTGSSGKNTSFSSITIIKERKK